jgi:prephenate dehydrogenase
MAGSQSGIEAAKAHLFENAYFMVTPLSMKKKKNSYPEKLLLRQKGNSPVSALEHDHMTAVVSTFPFGCCILGPPIVQ